MKHLLYRYAFLLPMLLTVLLSGCGDGLSSLKGKITIDGQPAPKGFGLELVPTDSNLLPVYAYVADNAGNYEALFSESKKGVQPGEYKVRLLPQGDGGMPELDASGNPIAKENENAIPNFPTSFYSEMERLTVVEGNNTKNFHLKTQAE